MTSPTTRDDLDKIAGNYHLSPEVRDKEYDDRFHQYSFNWILEEIGSAKRVLEMGFGEGNFTDLLLAAGKEVEIVEGSLLLVEQARARFENQIEVHQCLFTEFRPNEKFDRILASNILEHVDDPVQVLKCIRTWLRPGGLVLVTVPNAESIHRRLAVLMGIQPQLDTLSERDHMVGHQRVYNLDTLTADIHAAGFEVLSTKGFVLKTLPNSMMQGFSEALLDAFHEISNQIDPRYLANLGLVLKDDNSR